MIMAKRKKTAVAKDPVIHAGVQLPLDHPEIPEKWMPVDDFSSHRPMLYRAIMNTHHNAFFEFGIGQGSTPLLKRLYATDKLKDKDYVSYENNLEWYETMKTPDYKHVNGYYEMGCAGNHYLGYNANLLQLNTWKGSIVFIDSAPGELRKELISKHSSSAKIIIVHDTEPGAEYVYGLSEILAGFKYRCDLIVEGAPQTTVVSNLYEFSSWKTLIDDQIKFI